MWIEEGNGKKIHLATIGQLEEDTEAERWRAGVYKYMLIENEMVQVLMCKCINDERPLKIWIRLSTSHRGANAEDSVATVDTGAVYTCMDFDYAMKKAGSKERMHFMHATPIGLYAASGTKLKEVGRAFFLVIMGGVPRWSEFILIKNLVLDIVLGRSWLEPMGAIIDMGAGYVQARGGTCVPFIQTIKGEIVLDEDVPRAREETILRAKETMSLPGRSLRCIDLRAEGNDLVTKVVGFVRPLCNSHRFTFWEGLAVMDEGECTIAVVNPYPRRVKILRGQKIAHMTLCNDSDKQNLECKQMGEDNIFGRGIQELLVGCIAGKKRGGKKEMEGEKEKSRRRRNGKKGRLKEDDEEMEQEERKVETKAEVDEVGEERMEELLGNKISAEGVRMQMSSDLYRKLGIDEEEDYESYLEEVRAIVIAERGFGKRRVGWRKEELQCFRDEFPDIIEKFNFVGCTLSKKGLLALLNLLKEFRKVWDRGSGKFRRTTKVEHRIDLIPGTLPHKDKLRRTTWIEDQITHRHVEEMAKKGVIQPSSSPFASAV